MMDIALTFGIGLVVMVFVANIVGVVKAFENLDRTSDTRFQKSAQDGLLYFQKVQPIEYFAFGAVMWDKRWAKNHVAIQAELDAGKSEYRNVFGDNEMKDHYDKTFKQVREAWLKGIAIKDAVRGMPNKVSDLPAEQAIYQEAYFKKAQEETNVQKVLHERVTGLYANDDEKNAEPLSYEDFKMMMQRSA